MHRAVVLLALLASVVSPLPSSAVDTDALDADPIGLFPESEGAGVVASRQYPDVYWAHRGSGDGARNVLYAFKVVDGQLVDLLPGVAFRTVDLPTLSNGGWEDIAVDDAGHLWLGATGDDSCTRTDAAVHQLLEPDPYGATEATVVATYPIAWPDPEPGCTGRDAESLLVAGGTPYLVSKADRPALYRLDPVSTATPNLLIRLGELTPPPGGFDQLTTAADLSRDQRRLVVATAAERLWVYESSDRLLTGDALLLDLIGRPPVHSAPYRADGSDEPVAGAAFAGGTPDLLLLSAERALLYQTSDLYEASTVEGGTVSQVTFTGSGSADSGSWQAHTVPVEAGSTITATLSWDDPTADLNLFVKDPSGTTVAYDNGSAHPKVVTTTATDAGDWSVAVKIKSGATSYTLAVETGSSSSPTSSSSVGQRADGPLVPDQGALLGMWPKPRDGSYSQASQEARWADLEQAAGRTFDIGHAFYPWEQPFPSWRETYHLDHGRTPMISWNGTTTTEIAAGLHDELVGARADAVRELGEPVFLRWFWEMDGNKKAEWAVSPGDYVAAWRHLYDVFTRRGATNAVWVWCPNASAIDRGEAAAWYPGDGYVDWVCGDGYNWSPGRPDAPWEHVADIFAGTHAWGTAQGKPVMIGETGVQEREAGEKPAWFRTALTQLQQQLPGIAALVYFDSDTIYPWWVDSSPESLDAFVEIARDPYLDPRGTATALPEPSPEPEPEPAPEPEPEPVTATVSVAQLSYTLSGKHGRDVQVTVHVVDATGKPVPGAVVTATTDVDRDGDGVTDLVRGPWSDTTTRRGEATYVWRNAPAGRYHTVVVDVVAAEGVWDGQSPPNTFVHG